VIDLLTRNIWWKLLAVLIAVLLWIAVANEPELSTFVSVPVEYKDLSENIEVSSDPAETVDLELRGPAGELRTFHDTRTAVVLDMSGVRPGQRTFNITENNVQLPRGLSLIRAIPSQLRFQFERRITRSVPVEVRFYTPPGSLYEVAGYRVNPPWLSIVGPENRVNRVRAVITDTIDASALKDDSDFHVNAFAEDARVRFEGESEVAVHAIMKKR
jgi:YbbR domain-containing protein